MGEDTTDFSSVAANKEIASELEDLQTHRKHLAEIHHHKGKRAMSDDELDRIEAKNAERLNEVADTVRLDSMHKRHVVKQQRKQKREQALVEQGKREAEREAEQESTAVGQRSARWRHLAFFLLAYVWFFGHPLTPGWLAVFAVLLY